MNDLSSRDLRAALSGEDPTRLSDETLLAGLLSFSVNTGAVPLACKLLSACGTLSGVLSSDGETLRRLGVSDHTACLLQMLLPAYGRALLSEIPCDTVFDSVAKIGDYFTRLFCGVTVEKVHLMLLRENYTLLSCKLVAVGSVNSANLNLRSLLETALFADAKYAVLAHNHPGGAPQPSASDIATTVNLKNAFESVGVGLLEHLVVAGKRFVPILLSSDDVCREVPDAFYQFPGELADCP